MMRAVRRRWSVGAVPVTRLCGAGGDAGAAAGWRRCLSSDATPKVLRGGHSKSGKKRKFKTNRNRRYILDPASHAKEQYQEYRHPQPPSPGMAPFVDDPKKMIKLLVSAEKVRMAMLQPQDFSVLDMTKEELALNPPAPKEPLELGANDVMPGHAGHLPKQAHALTGGPHAFLDGSVVVKEPVTPLKEKQFYLDLQEVALQDRVDEAIKMLDELLAKDNVDSTTKDNALAAVVSSIVRARTVDEAAEFVEDRVFRQGKYVTAAVVHALVNGLFLKRDFERAESIWHSLRCRSPFEMTTALFHLRLKQMAQVRNGYKARELIEEFEDYHLSPLLLNMLDLSVPEEFAEAFGTRGAYFQAMHACAKDDENTEETFKIYERFKATGLPANSMALTMLLKACATQGDVARAKQVWKEFRRENPKVRPNLQNFNEVLNVYAKRALKLRKGSRRKLVDPNPHLRVKPVDEARELIKVLAFLPKDALFNPRWRKQLLEATLELDAIEEEARLRGLEDIGGHDDNDFQAALQKAKAIPDEEFHYIDEDENENELEEDEDVELMPMYQGAKILDHAALLKEERALMTELGMEAAAADSDFAESLGTARDSQLQGEQELEQFLADAGLGHLMDEQKKEMAEIRERAAKGSKHSDELEKQLSMSGLAREQIDEMLEASKDWPVAEREMMISSLTESVAHTENEEDSKDDEDDVDKSAPWFQESNGSDPGFDEEDQFDAEEHFARSIQDTAHVSNAVVPGGAHVWAKANATKSSDLENALESEQDTLPLEYSIASKDLVESSSNEGDALISDIAVSSETLPQKVEEFSDELGWAEDDGPPLTSDSYEAMLKDYTEGRIGPIISEIDEEDEPDTMMGYFDAPVETISEEQPRNVFTEADTLFDHVFSKDNADMKPSIATMNIMLQVYANGLRLNRLEQFLELKFDEFGVKRDGRSYSLTIAAFCHAKKATKAKELFERAVKELGSVKELHPDAPGYMCKVMTRAGRLEEAVDYLRILYECGHPIREKYVASLRIVLEKDEKKAMRLRPEDVALVPPKPHKALGYEASSKMARNTKVDKEARKSSKRLERTLLRHLRR